MFSVSGIPPISVQCLYRETVFRDSGGNPTASTTFTGKAYRYNIETSTHIIFPTSAPFVNLLTAQNLVITHGGGGGGKKKKKKAGKKRGGGRDAAAVAAAAAAALAAGPEATSAVTGGLPPASARPVDVMLQAAQNVWSDGQPKAPQ